MAEVGEITTQRINCPRSMTHVQEPVRNIELHAFEDASGKGVAAAVYAVITQPSIVNQGLVTVKVRLAKQGLTIPRRKLVSRHMAVNSLLGKGEYKLFVTNRVRKIREHGKVTWRHVSSKDKPAELGSRGGPITEDNQLWWKGPS